jgi:hypothetical protein
MGAVIGLAFLYGVKKYTAKEDVLADKDPAPKYGFLLKDARKLNKLAFDGLNRNS